jgi:hypothetical protein
MGVKFTGGYKSIQLTKVSTPQSQAGGGLGTKLFILERSNKLHEYSLSSPFDVTTATFTSTLNITNTLSPTLGMAFNPAGDKLVICDFNENILQYNVSNPYTISSASYDTQVNVTSNLSLTTGLRWGPNGNELFVSSWDSGVGSLNTTSAYDITGMTFNSVNSIYGTNGVAAVEFNNTGSKIYVTRQDIFTVTQYTLSPAYSISSPTLDTSYNTGTQENDPNTFYWNDDGTLAVVAGINQTIYEYTTSTPYDVSSLTYSSKFFTPSEVGSAIQKVYFN